MTGAELLAETVAVYVHAGWIDKGSSTLGKEVRHLLILPKYTVRCPPCRSLRVSLTCPRGQPTIEIREL
jgi:hypothetical protein